MNELEQKVECYKCDVETALLELRQAELELSHGGRFLEEAKEKYGKLKIAVEGFKIKVRREQSFLKKAESDAAKGFVEDKV